MRKIWTIIKREYKEAVYKKSFIILTLLMPLLMIAFAVLPALLLNVKSAKQVRIHVVDESNRVFESLKSNLNETLKNGKPHYLISLVEIPDNNLSSLIEKEKKLVAAKKIDVLLYIPADVDSSLRVDFYARNVADLDLTRRFTNEISSILSRQRLLAAGIQPELVESLTKPVKLSTIKITKEGKESKSGFVQEYFGTFIFIFFLYLTLILYGSGILRSIIQEKNSRIVETILSGSNSFQYMAGKIMGTGLVSLTQYLIWGIVGIALLFWGSAYYPESAKYLHFNPLTLLYFIVFFVLGYLLYSVLYAAVGAVSNSEQEAQNLAYPVTLSLAIPLVLVSYLVKTPNSTLSLILSQIPLFSPIVMFARINLANPPLWEILLSILILILTIAATIWFVAKIFRIGILMYGKRPTLPEMLKWIKY